jgi:hypothetical protein
MSINGKCINIGCGSDVRLGWINCDLMPSSDKVKCFNITSQNDLAWLSKTPSKIIECNHVIGYLNYIQALNFFNACFSSLVIKGQLIIEFPDIAKISKQLIENDYSSANVDSYIELIRGVYAYDHDDALDANFNKQTYIFGWTGEFVRSALLDIGYSQVQICPPKTHGQRIWRDTRIEAIK